MLPTFVIGLREGLEAALIVGIIAAFLRRQHRRDLLRQMAGGVALAIVLCIGVGVALELFSRDLPQQQQEALETVIGVLAVAMVTYMVVWMKENSRGLKGQLEGAAADALASGGSRAGRAMVFMAFLAVLREGFETVVFLMAAFNETDAGTSALVGAVLGITVAVVLGYGLYRGGIRINLSKFFRATGLVLVLVAAGLVVSALHTAHEAGWLNVGQQQVLDLSWLVQPGSVLSSLLTGMLGIQAQPTLAEVIGWLVYLVPVGVFVTWPQNRPVPLRGLVRGLSLGALAAVAAGVVLGVLAPATAASRPTTSDGKVSARVLGVTSSTATVRTQERSPLSGEIGPERDIRLTHSGNAAVGGITADVYTASFAQSARSGQISTTRAAALNGGRLPVGTVPDSSGRLPATYRVDRLLKVTVEPLTDRVLGLTWSASERIQVSGTGNDTLTLEKPNRTATVSLASRARTAATLAAHRDLADLHHRQSMTATAWLLGCLGLAAGGCAVLAERRRRVAGASRATRPAPDLVNT